MDPITEKHMEDMERRLQENQDSRLKPAVRQVFILFVFNGKRWVADSAWTDSGKAMDRKEMLEDNEITHNYEDFYIEVVGLD